MLGIRNLLALIIASVTTLLILGCVEGAAKQVASVKKPEVRMAFQIPYDTLEFLAIREELTSFAIENGYLPRYSKDFANDALDGYHRDFWLNSLPEKGTTKFAIAMFLGHNYLEEVIEVQFIVEGFVSEQELENIADAFISQFATKRDKPLTDITQRFRRNRASTK